MNFRYALYFIPEPKTLLAALGSALLGRDSETGQDIAQTVLPGFSPERLRGLTADARRYGLHATLKAPFFLKPGQTEQSLLEAATSFLRGRKRMVLPRIAVTRIGSFFALAPVRETQEERVAVGGVNAFAAEVLSFFDAFRAEPSEQEIARRKPHTLSARQRELLAAWGYPYVLDEYRFHITLTDSIDDQADAARMEARIEAGLHGYFSALAAMPLHITGICVCRQDMRNHEPGAHPGSNAFTLLQRFTMGEHNLFIPAISAPQ